MHTIIRLKGQDKMSEEILDEREIRENRFADIRFLESIGSNMISLLTNILLLNGFWWKDSKDPYLYKDNIWAEIFSISDACKMEFRIEFNIKNDN